jgi:hypothetical protein
MPLTIDRLCSTFDPAAGVLVSRSEAGFYTGAIVRDRRRR